MIKIQVLLNSLFKTMKINDALELIDASISNPSEGLPEDIFLFISRYTPLINVDLLIIDDSNRILLSWRDDEYCGTGWHVPGGIIRFRETLEHRILKVAETEIGTAVKFDATPMAINQIFIKERNTRGHYISLLYRCTVPENFIPQNAGLKEDAPGYLKWHDVFPENMITVHHIYKPYFKQEI